MPYVKSSKCPPHIVTCPTRRECLLQALHSVGLGCTRDRQRRHDALSVDVLALRRAVLGYSEHDRGAVGEPLDGLNEPFAVCTLTDHFGRTVALQRRREHLGGRGSALVDEHVRGTVLASKRTLGEREHGRGLARAVDGRDDRHIRRQEELGGLHTCGEERAPW